MTIDERVARGVGETARRRGRGKSVGGVSKVHGRGPMKGGCGGQMSSGCGGGGEGSRPQQRRTLEDG
jgi:hypothetical protein